MIFMDMAALFYVVQALKTDYKSIMSVPATIATNPSADFLERRS